MVQKTMKRLQLTCVTKLAAAFHVPDDIPVADEVVESVSSG